MSLTKSESIEFECLEVEQPMGTFYVGVLSKEQLTKIATADIRSLEGGSEREFLRFTGFQRPLVEGRVRELRQYVNTFDAGFPTSILLAIEPDNAQYDEKRGVMWIRDGKDVAVVIDGQHRIAGLESAEDRFDSIVAIFVDIPDHEKATIFATINLKQTRVRKSLAYELFHYAEKRSTQKTAHDIAVLLNEREGSPLWHRIKRLGVATEGIKGETVAQALIVEGIIRLISRDPMADRDTYHQGKKPNPPDEDESDRHPFRRFFVEERDSVIARNAFNIFEAASEVWPVAWQEIRPGNVLNRTTGVHSLLRFMGTSYR